MRIFKILVAAGLLVVGIGLAAFGVLLHKIDVAPKNGAPASASPLAEPQVNAQVSIGGLQRSPDGTIQRTYGAEEPPPAACPT